MPYGIREIDHVVCAVGDIERAAEALERIGFLATPRGSLTSVGVANRLVLFRPPVPGLGNFYEVMQVVDEARVPASCEGYFEGEPGCRWMVLSGDDALASCRQLEADGYAIGAPLPIERDWRLDSGERLRLAFDTTLPVGAAPVPFNFCQYRTPEPYAREEFLHHPNGALTITALLCAAAQPGACVGYFERLFSAPRRERAAGFTAVGPGSTELIVARASSWSRVLGAPVTEPAPPAGRLIGCRVRVRDVRATARFFADRGLATREGPFGLILDSPLGDRGFWAFHD
jgi:hypothetical protein